MSAHPDQCKALPSAPLSAPCPVACMALVGYTCPHVTGYHRIRKQHATCALPPDARRALVRSIGCFDGARAGRLARHFGLPRDCCRLD